MTDSELRGAVLKRLYDIRHEKDFANLQCLDITGDQFHPEWNYMITPGQQSKS
jgi:hypothetical protein